ncbi:MAG: sulfatase [Prosthecobacter sp.]|nr:sulfatase [Prosthecobacter sp.]
MIHLSQTFRPLLLLTLLLCAVSSAPAAEPRTNVVFILVDDLRWNALGCMGDKIVKTPNIDRLAKEGVLFNNMFVTTSICAISRASILTGQWARRHGIDDFGTGISAEAWKDTYPAQFRAAGWRTGFVGKYGVGNEKVIAAKAPDFDFWRGEPRQAGRFFIEPDDPTRTHKTAKFGNAALDFLDGCDGKQPFSLSLSFNAVHARDHEEREYEPDPRDDGLYDGIEIPLPKLATDAAFQRLPASVQQSEGRKRWTWRFDDPQKAQRILHDYYSLITGMDREVGRILDTLEKKGLTKNTVVIFSGDNGYALADRGMADKWYPYDEDLRVPLIIRDPRLPAERRGAKVDAFALNVDLAATMLDMAGLPVPQAMQGRSLQPLLSGDVPSNWRTEFFYEHHAESPTRIPPSEAVRTQRWKFIRWMEPNPVTEELYDLQADPLEEHNLIADPAHAATANELRAKREKYGRELR